MGYEEIFKGKGDEHEGTELYGYFSDPRRDGAPRERKYLKGGFETAAAGSQRSRCGLGGFEFLEEQTAMKPAKFVASMIVATALLPNWPTVVMAAGTGKQVLAQRGGKAADHMSEKGSTNSNAQWSADPERGWVRSDKRHELHEQSGAQRETNRQFDKAKHKRKTD